MSFFRTALSFALFFAFPAALLTAAAQGADTASKTQNGQNSPQFNVQNQIEGKIVDLHRKTVEGAKRVCAKLALPDGAELTVDLGKPAETKGLKLRKGEEIKVSGPLARFSDEITVLADRATANDKTVPIDRSLRDVKGEITAIQYTAMLVTEAKGRTMEEAGTTHLVAAVTEKNGQKVWIDFGPGRDVSDMKLQPGNEISVRGSFAAFPSGDVLVAHDLESGNQSFTVKWNNSVFEKKAELPGEKSQTPNNSKENAPENRRQK